MIDFKHIQDSGTYYCLIDKCVNNMTMKRYGVNIRESAPKAQEKQRKFTNLGILHEAFKMCGILFLVKRSIQHYEGLELDRVSCHINDN